MISDSPSTSIIIPTYNGLSLLIECVNAIRKYTTTPYQIIIVDNGSTDGTSTYCRNERLTYVSLSDNRGFTEACNIGMKMCSGDAVLLLNNDVVVSHRWLDNMLDALFSDPEVGIVGPTTNYASGRQQVVHPYEQLDEFHQIALEKNEPDPSKRQFVQRIVGLCFLFKRSLIDAIGLLDERFSPGHYEDDDYCYRARMHGFKLLMCGDVLVHHHGSASFRNLGDQALKELVDRNYRVFQEKWNVDPHLFM
ncbi:glycosyltransferase family 2 protein [Paenibacillus sp. 481]|uniref:glycosyltransferase family 2 protein n=1 Tax=Paenibacillus sp. 481 TaxID=2835869 RepID=UPI001E4C90A1|nr:glycosyltransferase family 2 protein [Paenibacillus sp. 481]UHA74512.1 glycosyltransferase family 2 protein [Paenibacillus sp. 481]